MTITNSEVWDAENRLVQMTNVAAVPAIAGRKLDFVYDYMGRRVQKMVSTNSGSAWIPVSTNRFVYDGWNLLAIINPQSSILQSFMWGLDLSGSMQGAGGVGGLLEVSYHGSSTTNCFAAYDGNGNLTALINAADGNVVANYEYGAFGEPIRVSGVMANFNPIRWSTKYTDDESGLVYYGYRSYNPSIGRWLSRDLLEEGLGGENLYAFAYNNPVDYLDQFGLCVSCGTPPSPTPPPSPHTCPIGNLDYKRGRYNKVSTVADIKKHCPGAPACSSAPYNAKMTCKKCTTPGCNQWTIILNIKATCDTYFLDSTKVTTFHYIPDLDHALKHEDCHCDDWQQAYQDIINQVGSVQYSSETACEAAKGNINLDQMINTQIAPSKGHVDAKWGLTPPNPNAACYAIWEGTL